MRFEERELKPYAEPFPPESLKTGETYFAVLFLDDNGFVPRHSASLLHNRVH
jgi:hypothetical protein